MVGKDLENWTKPSRRDIKPRKIVEVWSAPKGQPRYLEGTAQLIELHEGWRGSQGLPYLAYEREGKKYTQLCYMWSSESWVVEWIKSDYQKVGSRSVRKIHFFLCKNWRYPSGYIRLDSDEEPYSNSTEEKIAHELNEKHFHAYKNIEDEEDE